MYWNIIYVLKENQTLHVTIQIILPQFKNIATSLSLYSYYMGCIQIRFLIHINVFLMHRYHMNLMYHKNLV